MLTERQQKIVNNWESEDEGNKKEVRRKFKEALEILPLLCELPPHEAREIVNDSIHRVGENNNWSQEKEMPPGMPNSQRVFYAEYFVECVIAILFNGVIEHLFQNGLEDGLKRGERWWMGRDLRAHDPVSRFVHTLHNLPSGFDSEPKISNRIREPPVTPKYERERLKWILLLTDDFDNVHNSYVDFLLKCDIFNINSEEICEDKNKKGAEPFFEEEQRFFSDEIANYDTLLQAREAIESSQRTAEKVAAVLNNPSNDLSFSFVNTELSRREKRYVERVKRFYIEIHREYLDQKDLLPEDDCLPEASSLIIGAPDASKLDLQDI